MKAFPWHEGFEKEAGMDLRDYFAAKAMQADITGMRGGKAMEYFDISKRAYEMADAMMEARK